VLFHSKGYKKVFSNPKKVLIMDKTKINYVVDLGLAVSFLLVLVTGVLKYKWFSRLVLSHRAMPLAEITLVHDWSGLAFAFLGLIHLVLHWNWFISVTKTFLPKKVKNKKKNNEKRC
jgi:hypothetical protein